MSNSIFLNIDNEVIELTGSEAEDFLNKLAEENAAEQARIAAKESARQALLDRLGITSEEAQLLLGGN
jgi:hypothetical protein